MKEKGFNKTLFLLETFKEAKNQRSKKEIFQLLATRLIIENLPYDACLVHLFNEVKKNLYPYISSGIKYQCINYVGVQLGEGVISKVYEDGQYRITDNFENTSLKEGIEANGFKSMITIQIKGINKEKYGTFSLFTIDPYVEDLEDELFLENFSEQLNMLVEGILLQKRISDLSFINEFIHRIIPIEKKIDDVLRILLHDCLRHINGQMGFISLFSKDSDKISAIYIKDITGQFSNLALHNSLNFSEVTSISSWVIANKKSYLYHSDSEIDKLYTPYESMDKDTIQSELLVPLLYKFKVIGLLVVSSTKNFAFDYGDQQFLEKIANEAAEVIQSKIFYEASKVLISQSFFEDLNEHKICQTAADITVQVLATLACSVWLLKKGEEGEYLLLSGWYSNNDEKLTESIIKAKEGGISWKVLNETREGKEKEFIDTYHNLFDPASGFLHTAFAIKFNLKSMLCVPIVHNNEVMGIVNTYTSRKYDFFESEKLLLKSIADRCAGALFNARLNAKNEELSAKWSTINVIANPGIVALAFIHDITHDLHYFNTDLDLLDDFIPRDTKNYKLINSQILALTNHADHLRKSFTSLVRIGKKVKTKKRPIYLKKILEDVQHLFRTRFEENKISFSFEIENGDIIVNCRSNEIEQVLVNMILNSYSALEKVTHRKKEIKVEVQDIARGGKQYVKIEVYDNGVGIPKRYFDDIYRADFSTKGEDGSGFGLSICKTIIEGTHSGELLLESEEGKWTRFFIYLPKQ